MPGSSWRWRCGTRISRSRPGCCRAGTRRCCTCSGCGERPQKKLVRRPAGTPAVPGGDRSPGPPSLPIDLGLIAVLVRLVGPFLGHADVAGLLVAELGEPGVEGG